MKWSSFAHRMLGRETVIKVVHSFQRFGIVVQSPMHSLHPARNRAVLEGEYVRASSLELVAREIYDRGVAGAVAEVGVYRGEFARLINAAFPDRPLYLFDTFGGFTDEQIQYDIRNGHIKSDPARWDPAGRFSKTSVNLVLSRMRFQENCIIVDGTFPQSAAKCPETNFAFVSIDCDLYCPVSESIKYFYPRLSPGGYIFVHDYNNSAYGGVKKAVREYAAESGISYFPLSDASGSAIICKP
jgi:O-methyltransferase